jgi:hypothetical protein
MDIQSKSKEQLFAGWIDQSCKERLGYGAIKSLDFYTIFVQLSRKGQRRRERFHRWPGADPKGGLGA